MSAKAHNLEEKVRTKDVLLEEQLNFNALLLSEQILSGLQLNGFKVPSPIQLKAIPIGKCGFDLIIKSKSGTGKTAVFSIIALEQLDIKKNYLQALILTPTREITVQVQDVIRGIGSELGDLRVESFIGGLPLEGDIKKIAKCHIAVGAPGRIKHLVQLGSLKTDKIKLFILDEADKLMCQDMKSDIEFILKKLPPVRQIVASSATYSPEVLKHLNNIMSSPTLVEPNTETPVLLGLKQFVSIVKSNLNAVPQLNIKNNELIRLLSQITFSQCLVFTNYQTRAESISNVLNRSGWKNMYISAAQPQTERLKVISMFREGKCRILLSTDISARGIDVANVDLVINYDIPINASTYLHRMGRAGRFGSHGICITIAAEGKDLNDYKKIFGGIGGVNVPQLPNEGNLPNLWNIDSNSLKLIQGITDNSSELLEKVTSSIRDIKIQRSNLKEKESNKNNKRNETAEENDDTANKKEIAIETLLENNRKKEEILKSEVLSRDAESLLKDLASGDNPLELESSHTSSDEVSDSSNSKKRKRNLKSDLENIDDLTQKLPQEKKHNSDDIMPKNLALYSATSLLYESYETNQIPDDSLSTLNTYLKDVEKTGNVHKEENEMENSMVVENDYNINDILKLSFDYAVNRAKTHWLDILGEKFDENLPVKEIKETPVNLLEGMYEKRRRNTYTKKKTFRDFTKKSKRYKNDIVYDQSMDTYDSQPLIATNNQVDSNYYEDGLCSDYEYANNQHFTSSFDYYSDALTEKMQTFENEEQYNKWFSEWQRQVQGVRDYIQQKVYLQEMNKFTYNKY